jgi:hypothetical protein
MAGKMAGAGAVAVAGDPAPPGFSANAEDAALRRFVGWAIVLITSGYTFLDYWNYSRTWHEGGGSEWDALLAGRGIAPAQYRIGVIRVAGLLASLTHTQMRHTFAAIDFVCLGVSLLLLFRLLMRSGVFAAAERMGRWLQASLGLGCVLLYLLWSFWYQKPETCATLLLLVLSAAAAQGRRPAVAGLALVVLAALGATVRADAMAAFHAGFLLTCLLPQGKDLPLGRRFQMVASAASLLAALGVEYWIVHVLYPHAPREVSAFQLWSNLTTLADYLVLLVSLFPWWLTLRLAVRRRRALDGWPLALLAGSVIHFVLFYCFGMAGEVRIFLPFAMTTMPVAVTLGYAAIAGREVEAVAAHTASAKAQAVR